MDAFIFSRLMRMVQLPSVGSNETVKFSTGEESLITDMGTRANSQFLTYKECPISLVCLLTINFHLSGLGTVKIV